MLRLSASALPAATRLLCFSNKPTPQARAFQEMHDEQLTLMEGTVLAQDLLREVKVEHA